MNQQPSRDLSSLPSPPATLTAVYQVPNPPAPRTQIEAMPPFQQRNAVPISLPMQAPAQIPFDASRRHPVFFTDRLMRAPNGVNAGGGGWISPVAEGYVFNDGAKRRVSSVVKL
jgi:hypothetical protein